MRAGRILQDRDTPQMRPSSQLLVALCMSISLAVYSLYRSVNTLINVLLCCMIPADQMRAVRLATHKLFPLPPFVVGSLPGGLWVFAATLLAKNSFLTIRNSQMSLEPLPALVAIVFELLQWFGLTDGTFDPIDILTALAGWGIAGPLMTASTPSLHFTQMERWRMALCFGSYAILVLADVHK